MRKKYGYLLLLISCLLVFAGCAKKEETAKVPEEDKAVSAVLGDEAADEENLDEKVSENEFTFSDLKYVHFWFGSGAGGWRTVLAIEEEGSFSGEYSDSEMGSAGEDYPAGTTYHCEFSGKFTEPVKVNDYTYSMQIAEISYENEPGTEEIRDGQKYIYTEPYGLEDAENILIYLPGTLTKDIPEECAGWLTGSGQFSMDEKEIPFYALNNEVHQEGFCSYDIIENIREDFKLAEVQAAQLENVLEEDSLSQADLNVRSGELYKLWDDFLNRLWGVLKDTKDAEFMEALLAEQREWIKEKEKAIEEAAAEVEGGSLEPFVRNSKATELTKARVYELMKLLEE